MENFQICSNSTLSSLTLNWSHCSVVFNGDVQSKHLSYFDSVLFVIVNRVALSAVFGLSGVASNIINMAIFLRQGLSVSMNINFFVLAAVDLIRTLNYMFMAVCSYPYIDTLEAPFVIQDIQYLVAGWISGCMERITIFITASMTAQRCVFLAKPMKIQNILTPCRSLVVIFLILLINSAIIVPECMSAYFDWNYYPSKNRTMLGLVYRVDRDEKEGVAFTMHAVLYVISLTAVIAFTIVLVVQMKRRSKWRQITLQKNQHQTVTKRDKKTSKLVSLVAIFLIVFCTPTVVLSMVSTFVPPFSVNGNEVNLFFAVWSFAFLLGAINANVNIFIYYKMSSKYRDTFAQMFFSSYSQYPHITEGNLN